MIIDLIWRCFMDSNVLAAQKYLNTMFGVHPSWKPLKEDGNTGTNTM